MKRAPRSRQRHDLYAKYHDCDSEISDLLGECGLNGFLVRSYSVAEDRLLGFWFVKDHELGGRVPSKILLYLWDDLLRHEDRSKVFATGLKTYGQVNDAITHNRPVFSEDLLAALGTVADAPVPAPSGTEPDEAGGSDDNA